MGAFGPATVGSAAPDGVAYMDVGKGREQERKLYEMQFPNVSMMRETDHRT